MHIQSKRKFKLKTQFGKSWNRFQGGHFWRCPQLLDIQTVQKQPLTTDYFQKGVVDLVFSNEICQKEKKNAR